jgi:hypothetical protein
MNESYLNHIVCAVTVHRLCNNSTLNVQTMHTKCTDNKTQLLSSNKYAGDLLFGFGL